MKSVSLFQIVFGYKLPSLLIYIIKIFIAIYIEKNLVYAELRKQYEEEIVYEVQQL